MRFAAFGRTRFLLDAITAAAEAGHQPVLVGTCRAEPFYGVDESEFEALAHHFGCPFFNDIKINAEPQLAAASAANAEIAISANWLTVIGPAMRSIFPLGILNLHLGDLPRYRGNACPNWAILAGEAQVVATIHQMGGGIDDGPWLVKEALSLNEETYIGDIYRHFETRAPSLFLTAMEGLAAGTLVPQSQSESGVVPLRCYPRRPEDGRIDWRAPAETIHRLVRASSRPLDGAFTSLEGGVKITVWRCDPVPHPEDFLAIPGQVLFARDGDPVVACGEGCLRLTEVEIKGGGGAEAKRSILRSLRNRLM